MFSDSYFEKFILPDDLRQALSQCRSIAYIETQEELDELAFGPTHTSLYDVVYTIAGRGRVKEAEVIRCKNGALVNFMEDYMRRRDPNSMVISDSLPTDKTRFQARLRTLRRIPPPAQTLSLLHPFFLPPILNRCATALKGKVINLFYAEQQIAVGWKRPVFLCRHCFRRIADSS